MLFCLVFLPYYPDVFLSSRVLFSRMRLVLKLTPVMIDPRINSKQGVAKNIYNAGLFMAFRFCAYVKALFPLKKMNTKFLVECLKRGEKAIKSKVVKALVSCGQGKEVYCSLHQFIFSLRENLTNFYSQCSWLLYKT